MVDVTPGVAISEECLRLAAHVPSFVRRILHVGCGRGELARALKEGSDVEVHGVEQDPVAARVARPYLDSLVVGDLGPTGLPFPDGHFDCIVLSGISSGARVLRSHVAKLAPLLAPNGLVLLAAPEQGRGRAAQADSFRGLTPEEAGDVAASVDMVVYATWVNQGGPADQRALWRLFTLVRTAYDPVAHARELFKSGHPGWSYDVLLRIPPERLNEPRFAATVFAEMELCLLAWDGRADPGHRLERFFTCQTYFYQATSRVPDLHQAYQCQAEFWRRLGNDDMAARLLRSVQRVTPSEATQRQLDTYRPKAPVEVFSPAPPNWSAPSGAPRVLFITHRRPNYGLDVLYDGLCTVLGDGQVTDFPWKPSLHGQQPDRQAHYPCLLDRPGQPQPVQDILAELRAGRFDLILFGDIEKNMDQDTARAIVRAGEGIPLFLIDAQDEPQDNRPAMFEYLGVPSALGCFKREMLACVDYGPGMYPLPFAYADSRLPEDVSGPRPHPLFWAGHRTFGLRRLYLERAEALLDVAFDRTYTQDEYSQALRAARIGLNLFGCGYDTVRYWELPAHGCMLLSERLPIRIPVNFVDGESAVFFDDLSDLEKKLDYYLERPEESAAIARAGYDHLKRHHLGSSRARQLLGWIQPAVDG